MSEIKPLNIDKGCVGVTTVSYMFKSDKAVVLEMDCNVKYPRVDAIVSDLGNTASIFLDYSEHTPENQQEFPDRPATQIIIGLPESGWWAFADRYGRYGVLAALCKMDSDGAVLWSRHENEEKECPTEKAPDPPSTK